MRGQVPPGYQMQAPPRQQQGTSTGLIVAIIVAVVLVAVCIGAAVAIVQQQNTGALGTGYSVPGSISGKVHR